MVNDGLTRKLATIEALDVAGYSARTEADEVRTTAEVAALREVINGIAAERGGRIFNTAGDGFMLEFGSSLAAVEDAFALAETPCDPHRFDDHRLWMEDRQRGTQDIITIPVS